MAFELVTAATKEPVLVEEAKNHLRVDIAEDDDLIDGYITTARQDMEEKYGVAFVTQTWDLYLDAFPGGSELAIGKWPLASVTSIKYTDEDGNESTYSSDDYLVDAVSQPGKVVLKSSSSWPSDTLQEVNAVVVRFVAGFGDATDVPRPVRQAVLLLVGDMYENRENTIIAQGVTIRPVAQAAEMLMMNYRNF